MLKIIKPISINRQPPEGWKNTGYGYFQMEKVISKKKIELDKEAHRVKTDDPQASLILNETFIEQQLFLNVLSELKGHIEFMELGAGRGDWCLHLAGLIDFKLIDTEINSYHCLAIEAEPTHYEWTKIHLEEQGINATILHGAISSKTGECKFYSVEDPASNYGQAIKENGNVVVPMYNIDHLVYLYNYNKIDLIHVDIQGSEYDMLLGATETLKRGLIKYMIIGTHDEKMNDKISDYLKKYEYECIFSIPCRSGNINTPLGLAHLPVDGIMLLKYNNDEI